jgi:DNA-binding HxlR family transcriptional regulator
MTYQVVRRVRLSSVTDDYRERGDKMEEKEKEFLALLGRKHTLEILDYIGEHRVFQYRDIQQFVSTHTLNTRLKQLRELGIIEHHFAREELRKEWYEPTEKGDRIIKYLRDLGTVIGE